jgi:hypothetical protein
MENADIIHRTGLTAGEIRVYLALGKLGESN